MRRRVLFVSKPIALPLHDGTKCVVRELAARLERHQAVVMTTRRATAAELGLPRAELAPVYRDPGRFAPALAANARAALWLALRARADLLHFVFAPNPRTAAVGRALGRLRRVPIVQTVASPPQVLAPEGFFGDVVVAQSEATARAVRRALAPLPGGGPPVETLPPPLGEVHPASDARIQALRGALGLSPGARVFVYPGDLEVSRAARTVVESAASLAERIPGAVTVLACRAKTPRAHAVEQALRRLAPAAILRFAGETDLRALFGAAEAVLFPVDDLRGKVDHPIALLEAMALGVPTVLTREGPLADIGAGLSVPAADPRALVEAVVALARDPELRAREVARGREAALQGHAPATVAAAYERLYDRLLGPG